MANINDAVAQINNLKIQYSKDFVDITKQDNKFKTSLKKSTEKLTGAGLQKMIQISVNSKGAATGMNPGPILPAGVPKYLPSMVYPRRYYKGVQLDNILNAIAGSDSSTFTRAVMNYIESSMHEAASYEERELFGTGSGIIGTIPTGATSANQTVDMTAYNIFNFPVGADIDIYSSAFVYRTTAAIVSIAYDTGVITFDRSFATVNGDVLTRTGVVPSTTAGSSMSGATGVQMEMTGIRAIIGNASDAATVQGINRANYPYLVAQVIDKANSAVTIQDIRRANDRLKMLPGSKDGGVDRYVTTHEIGRKILEQYLPLQRYSNPSEFNPTLDPEKINFDGRNIELYTFAVPGRFYGINDDTLAYSELVPLNFITTQDGISWTSQAVPGGQDTQAAAIGSAGQLITEDIGRTSFVIKNVLGDAF